MSTASKTDLLETSFALMCARKAEFTDHFYRTLFSDYPQVKPLFNNTRMDEQARKLFASLGMIVNNLQQPQTLTAALRGLSTRHVKYGVLPEHYPMVGATLIKVMATTLKDQWTPDFTAAWAEAYSDITQIILDGSDYAQTSLTPKI